MTETTQLFAEDAPNDGVEVNPTGQSSSTGPVLSLVVDLLSSGRFEHDPVIELEDRLLGLLGGSLWHPPLLDAGWELAPRLSELYTQGEHASDGLLAGPLGERDPRAGLLLPFWRAVLTGTIQATIVIDEPAAAASVLAEREKLSLVEALALYDRYYRIVAAHLQGEAVRVVCRKADAEVTFDDATILGSIDELYRCYEKSAGRVARFSLGLAGDESPWSAAVLSAGRDLEHVVAGLDWATRQIEPIVRAEAQPAAVTRPDFPGANETEDESERTEIDADEPYPLNASEDRRAYHRWLRARHEPVIVGGVDDPPLRRAKTRAPRGRQKPLVSVVVPVWRTPLWALERCVSSVLAQTMADWELCLCDDASGDPELSSYLRSLKRIDRRISTCALSENSGISAATNAAFANSRGRFVAFLDHDDELAPNALEEVAKAIGANPEADVLYSDEDKIEALGERFDPLFKPDWSPDLLLSFAYICHLTVVRRELLTELGGLRSEFDGSQDYDLTLRATERARTIVHIPEVLYHWRTLPGSAASDSPGAVAKPWAYEAGRRAIEDALQRRGEPAEVTADARFPGRYHVRRLITERPLVSIIVPFRDEPALLATCAQTLRENPGYDRIELVLVDNGSELPETAALLERLAGDNVTIVDAPGAFNWAALNNAAVRSARGEMLLFVNNDIEARTPRWLDALLGHALRPEVGAVGARLTYPDGAIQHAGVVIGLGGIAGHPLRGLPGTHPGYNSMSIQTRNCSVVTGACMMTRRDIFESVGGFNELLPVAFNDVDYCLKFREQGYLIVYTPLAELVHHESRSRGHTDDLVESRRIVSRWSDAIAAGDPYMSKHLSHWRYWCPLSTAQEDDRWKTYLETYVLTRASSSST